MADGAYITLTPDAVTYGWDVEVPSEAAVCALESSDGTAHADTPTETTEEGQVKFASWLGVAVTYEPSPDPGGGETATGVEVIANSQNTGEARTATVRIYNDAGAETVLTVTQEGASLTLTPDTITYAAELTDGAEAGSAEISSPDGTAYADAPTATNQWGVAGIVTWLRAAIYVTVPQAGTDDPTGLTAKIFALEANTGAARTAQVRIYDGSGHEAWLTVTQESAASYLTTDGWRLAYAADAADGAQVGTVTGTTSDTVKSSWDGSVPSWVEVGNAPVGADGRFKLPVYALEANPSGAARRATLRLYNDTGAEASFVIVQLGSDPYISVTPDTFDYAGEVGGGVAAGFVEVASSDGTAHADGLPSWLSLAFVWYADGVNGLINVYALEENPLGDARTATVRLYNDAGAETALTVTQEGLTGTAWRLLHYGEFPDIKNTVWRVEIYRRSADAADPSELTFPADQPLTIEWPSINFEDVMWGSSATLKVVSPGDRTYIDLYTIEPGTIRLDVYRDGNLYWSGMLDPEFYEEPYERLNGYEVELTFTDFGILDRLKYDLEGVQSVKSVINDAVERSGIKHSHESMLTKFLYGYTGIRFGEDRLAQDSDLFEDTIGIAVRSDNFTDEEGEVMTVMEVLEAVLQPLGLKMVQREGAVSLFDPTGLREALGTGIPAVVWTGDSQTLGVDRVYNSVTVTFSPYMAQLFFEDCVNYTSEYKTTWYNLTNNPADSDTHGDATCWTYYPCYNDDYRKDWDYSDLDFTIFTGTAEGVKLGSTGGFFHILPVYGSAEECSGVYFGFYTGGHGSLDSNYPMRVGSSGTFDLNNVLFTVPRVYIPAIGDVDEREEFLLRLTQEILLDCRYNPFSGEGKNNDNDNQSKLEKNSAFVFVRVAVTLYDSAEGGTALWHYDNSSRIASNGYKGIGFGEWKEGAGSRGWCILEYYNPDDLKDNAGGAGGWKANRHNIGKPDGASGREEYTETSALLRNAPDGEFIPWPPEGGWLEVAVYNTVWAYKYGSGQFPGDSDSWTAEGIYPLLRWWLYRSPSLHIVRNNLAFEEIDTEDVEYRGTLNAAAQDDLSIDTICGTTDGASPTARGLYVRQYFNTQPTEMYRGGVTGRPETLLIGQLHSQYAGRKTVLTGEAEIPGTLLLTEQNQGDKLFLLTADTQDIRMATSDIEIRELGEDTYEPES